MYQVHVLKIMYDETINISFLHAYATKILGFLATHEFKKHIGCILFRLRKGKYFPVFGPKRE